MYLNLSPIDMYEFVKYQLSWKNVPLKDTELNVKVYAVDTVQVYLQYTL